ncbi:hypothetical protein GPECTOR_7g1239 [Gonium pectorale]|uniref:Nucleoporin Nup54 alpha-helical domain-containing protein n=1 Tax=Gonium pectorale TaxID=33097 RepID=A0A150GU83_GONPE|nr:hypothetical protein GPECTOR_7g1239 [Gonium pectorale]|eukprot:KXZ53344.1 hypothetical protein GPECTOR_7g1239 [Gonium pectorale]
MAASPFQFGAAAPPASPFGFSTANAAAAPASSAPAFGAPASAPAFGTVSSTPAGFSFGSAAASGSAATPAFGATFGTAAAKPAAFGAAPAFGASTGGAFAFPSAAPAASAPGLFGGTSAPSLFGATSAPAFGAASSTPSLFGAANTGATAFGTAPAMGTTGGLFGAAAPTTSNIFGLTQPQQQQQTSMFGAAGQPALPGLVDPSGLTQDDAVRSLTRLAAAYNPNSPDYRFQTLFVSVVERPEQRVKPPGPVDENRWRAALAAIRGPGNAQKLWPVVANGFRDLNTRSKMQTEAVSQNAARLRELQDRAAGMARRANGEFRARIAALQQQHTALSHKLLCVQRSVDALEGRLALSSGYHAAQSRQQVAELSRQLGQLEEALAPQSAGTGAGLQRRLEAVAAAARMRAGRADGAGNLSSVRLDDRSQSQLFDVLRDHAEGVRQLQAVLKQDELDIEVLKRLLSGGSAAGGGAGSELTSAALGGV